MADFFAYAFLVYLGIGFLFSLAFVFAGAGKIDPDAQKGTIGFRLLIIPGSMALWPVLAKRWFSGQNVPPVEKNAHDKAAIN